jgi:ferric-dicitrate binding protein FerR (iron transport regulator)
MTHRDEDDRELIRRIQTAYAPPALTASQRARFDAELDARIARDRWRFVPWGAALVTAGAAAVALFASLSTVGPGTGTEVADATGSDEAFVQALAGGSPDELDAELPADYQAIASLLELP